MYKRLRAALPAVQDDDRSAVLVRGLDRKHCSRTPSPQSSRISLSAAMTLARAVSTAPRRAPGLASMD